MSENDNLDWLRVCMQWKKKHAKQPRLFSSTNLLMEASQQKHNDTLEDRLFDQLCGGDDFAQLMEKIDCLQQRYQQQMSCCICLELMTPTSIVQLNETCQHHVCKMCLVSFAQQAIVGARPQIPLSCPGRCPDNAAEPCRELVLETVLKAQLSAEMWAEYLAASLRRGTEPVHDDQIFMQTPCCNRWFEFDRRDEPCATAGLARLLGCPFVAALFPDGEQGACTHTFCTGCEKSLTSRELARIKSEQTRVEHAFVCTADETTERTFAPQVWYWNDVAWRLEFRYQHETPRHDVADVIYARFQCEPLTPRGHMLLKCLPGKFDVVFQQDDEPKVTMSLLPSQDDQWCFVGDTDAASLVRGGLILGEIRMIFRFQTPPPPLHTDPLMVCFHAKVTDGEFQSTEYALEIGKDNNTAAGSVTIDLVRYRNQVILTTNQTPLSNKNQSRHLSFRMFHPKRPEETQEVSISLLHDAEWIWPLENAQDMANFVNAQGDIVLYEMNLRLEPIIGHSSRRHNQNNDGYEEEHQYDQEQEEDFSAEEDEIDWNDDDEREYYRQIHNGLHWRKHSSCDHLGKGCYRQHIHSTLKQRQEPVGAALLQQILDGDIDEKTIDVLLHRLMQGRVDAAMPHCPSCKRIGLKSEGECNVIDCTCGTRWCFVCNRRMASTGEQYLRWQRESPDTVAYMQLDKDAANSPAILATTRLNSSYHHSYTSCAEPEQHRHDSVAVLSPYAPEARLRLCPSTLTHYTTYLTLPVYMDGEDDEDALVRIFVDERIRACLKLLRKELGTDLYKRGLQLLPHLKLLLANDPEEELTYSSSSRSLRMNAVASSSLSRSLRMNAVASTSTALPLLSAPELQVFFHPPTSGVRLKEIATLTDEGAERVRQSTPWLAFKADTWSIHSSLEAQARNSILQASSLNPDHPVFGCLSSNCWQSFEHLASTVPEHFTLAVAEDSTNKDNGLICQEPRCPASEST